MHSFTVTSSIHKTSHVKSFRSSKRSKWGSMHVYIAWQIYYREQQMKCQLKRNSRYQELATVKQPSLQCNLDTSSVGPVCKNSPHIYSFPSHHLNTDKQWAKLTPNPLCRDKGENKAKSERDLKHKTCRSHNCKPHYRKLQKEHPSACKAKRQTQGRQDESEISASTDFLSQTIPDLNAVLYSKWNNPLLPIYSPSPGQIYRHQMPPVDKYTRMVGSATPFYCPPVLTQDFKHKCLIQAPEQNLYAQYLSIPPATSWAHDNIWFGFAAESAQPMSQ